MFSEEERRIFSFEVGGQKRFLDPLAVRRALLRHSAGQFFSWRNDAVEPEDQGAIAHGVEGAPADPPELMAARRAGVVLGALDAQERVVECILAAFGLEPFDPQTGRGCTEEEAWALLDAYEEWLEKNAKRAGNSRTDSPSDARPDPAGQ